MNDKELDEVLDTWTVPPVPARLRDNVRAGFTAASLERKTSVSLLARRFAAIVPDARKRFAAGVTLGVLAFVLVVSKSFPQARSLVFLPLQIPFTVDSEFFRYGDDGSFSVDMYTTSFVHNGKELSLSTSFPGRPVATAIRQTLNWVGLVAFDFSMPFRAKVEQPERSRTARFVDKGCVVDGAVVVGRGTILGYSTVAVQERLGEKERATVWMAPDLGCFALRMTEEEWRPDEAFHLISRKQALRINVIEPDRPVGRLP